MREATCDDLLEMLRMSKLFVEALGETPNRESIVSTLENLIESDDGVVLITEGGMVGALCYPKFFNTDSVLAQEMFWWVDEKHRGNGIAGGLLTGLEEWARGKSADELIMIAVDRLEGGKVGKIYRKRGYKPFERSYSKEL